MKRISQFIYWLLGKDNHIPVPIYGDIAYLFGHELDENPFDIYSERWYKWADDWMECSRHNRKLKK